MSDADKSTVENVNVIPSKGGRRAFKVPHRCHWAALALVLVTYQLPCASMSTYESAGAHFDFERHAVALDAESRTRVAATVDLARTWCGFMVAIVSGHADPSEATSPGGLMELSVTRAAYVSQLLESFGMPRKRIYQEGKGAAQPSFQWSGRVEVDLKAEGRGKEGCSGFRIED